MDGELQTGCMIKWGQNSTQISQLKLILSTHLPGLVGPSEQGNLKTVLQIGPPGVEFANPALQVHTDMRSSGQLY